jgi:hypothetical protein
MWNLWLFAPCFEGGEREHSGRKREKLGAVVS